MYELKIYSIDEKQAGPSYPQQGIPVSPEYVNQPQQLNIPLYPQQQQQYTALSTQPQPGAVQSNPVPISTVPTQTNQPQYVQGQYVTVQPGQMPLQPIPVATMAPPRFENMYFIFLLIISIRPLLVECPYCHYTGPTRIEHQIGPILYIISKMLFIYLFF